MSDLVKRLRELETKLPTSSDNWVEARELQLEAAARIKELESKLAEAEKRDFRLNGLADAEQRGYDAAKEQAARIIDNLVAHLNLEQFLLVLRDKEKAAEISQAVIAILECEAAAIRAMVKP